MSHDLIVISGMGGVVQRIKSDGHLMWQTKMHMPRSLEVQEDELLVAEEKILHIISITTGLKLRSIEFDKSIVSVLLRGNELFVLMESQGVASVGRYELLNNAVKLVNSASIAAVYPRGMDVDEDNVYIADTFGNRVLRLDRISFILKDEVPSYFPNSVQVKGENLIVTEEHSNVVSEFTSNPLKRKKVLVGCPVNLLQNKMKNGAGKNIKQDIECDRIKNVEKLYSPNDARLIDGDLYIADTDNHRIIQIANGKVVAKLIEFNDPVSVRAIKR